GDLLQVPGATWDVRQTCFDSRPGDTDRYDDLARRLEEAYRQFRTKFESPAQPKARPAAPAVETPPGQPGKSGGT
ncbi:MAG: hypothetical protein ACREC6_06875, partial [Hyphomicrobiaceae bacterium]